MLEHSGSCSLGSSRSDRVSTDSSSSGSSTSRSICGAGKHGKMGSSSSNTSGHNVLELTIVVPVVLQVPTAIYMPVHV